MDFHSQLLAKTPGKISNFFEFLSFYEISVKTLLLGCFLALKKMLILFFRYLTSIAVQGRFLWQNLFFSNFWNLAQFGPVIKFYAKEREFKITYISAIKKLMKVDERAPVSKNWRKNGQKWWNLTKIHKKWTCSRK